MWVVKTRFSIKNNLKLLCVIIFTEYYNRLFDLQICVCKDDIVKVCCSICRISRQIIRYLWTSRRHGRRQSRSKSRIHPSRSRLYQRNARQQSEELLRRMENEDQFGKSIVYQAFLITVGWTHESFRFKCLCMAGKWIEKVRKSI